MITLLFRFFTSFILTALASLPLAASSLPLSSPCRLNLEALGPRFSGHDVVQLYEFLSRNPKDDFESLAQYRQRMGDVIGSAPDAVRAGRLCVVHNPEGALSLRYDAERQAFDVGMLSTYRGGRVQAGKYGYFVNVIGPALRIKKSTYSGSNAFGGPTDVFKTERDQYMVSFSVDDKDQLVRRPGVRDETGMAVVSVPLAGEIARTSANEIRVAFLYDLADPYFVNREDVEMPTIDWPFENISQQRIVYGKLGAVAIFNYATGDVYRFIELGAFPPSKKATDRKGTKKRGGGN